MKFVLRLVTCCGTARPKVAPSVPTPLVEDRRENWKSDTVLVKRRSPSLCTISEDTVSSVMPGKEEMVVKYRKAPTVNVPSKSVIQVRQKKSYEPR